MGSLYFISMFILIGQLLESSVSYAQSNNLLHCLELLHNTRKAINQNRDANQQLLIPALNPTYQQHKQNYENWGECVKGHKAPLTAFRTLDGESYDPAALSGKIVVINFWGMSCAPCVAEMPALNQLVKDYKGKNVLFFGFAGDRATSLTAAFFEKHPFDFKIIAEAKNNMLPFYSNSLPTTYIVDQQGIIQKAWIGLEGYNEVDIMAPYYKAKSAIDQLLKGTNK